MGEAVQRAGSGGQGVFEFALVLPVVLIVLLVLLDFGRVIYAQSVISHNATLAARAASAGDFCAGCSDVARDAAIRQKARTLSALVDVPDCAIYGESADPNCSSHAAGGAFVSTDGNHAVVTIEIQVPIITPLISSIVGGAVTVEARSEEVLH